MSLGTCTNAIYVGDQTNAVGVAVVGVGVAATAVAVAAVAVIGARLT